MHSSASTSIATRPVVRYRWRVVDIVVAAVLGVAFGLVFWFWNGLGYAWFLGMDALTPGLGGFAAGIWLLGGRRSAGS